MLPFAIKIYIITSCTLRALLRLQFNLNETRFFVLIVFIEELLNIQYLLFFPLVCTRINWKVFQRVIKPHTSYTHTVVHVKSMDFPNLVHTLVAIVLVLCWWSLQKRVTQEIANVWTQTTHLSESLECVATVHLLLWIFNLKLWLRCYCSSSFSLVIWSLVTWSLSHLVINLYGRA
jgi:hypothetical protein